MSVRLARSKAHSRRVGRILLTFTDSFDRPNDAVVGGSWVEQTGVTNLHLLSGKMVGTFPSPGLAWFNVDLGSDDHYVEVDIGGGGTNSIYFRATSGGPAQPTNFYEWSYSTASGGTFATRKFVAGVATAISSVTGVGAVDGHRLRITIQGITITYFTDGVQKTSFTDTAIAAGHYVGLRSDSEGNTFDNFMAGAL